MSANGGFSVRIFFPSGDPDALRIIEKSNWTGQGLVFPRALLVEARKRTELERPGVYVLWGPGDSGQLPRVYIGEGDMTLHRLIRHVNNKDFWTHAAVFTSKDESMHKAHVQYLEARLVELAREAKRAELDNGNVPQLPTLSKADQADAESFLQDLLLCLPAIGLGIFEKAVAGAIRSRDLILNAKNIEARGVDGSEGFIVRAGSRAVKDEVASIHAFLSDLRRLLVAQGVFELFENSYRLTQDYTFNSPSTAAGVLLGRSANGRIEWKDSQGRPLKEIQDAETEGE
jgi:hypothetical protein